jgi:uroporphyrinogen decarboxylase
LACSVSCWATRRDPELVAAVIQRVGALLEQVFAIYCQMEQVGAVWLGDDLGHKHGLLVSPRLLREQVFPWYTRFAQVAAQHGKPLVLHSCGNNLEVMDELIACGFSAKHSFEDQICPVETFYDRYREHVAVLGGD